jgi:quercetin dioxygenase-like cupin family protein
MKLPGLASAPLDGVVSLTKLLDYQPGTIVSRTIAKQPSGTVTAFAFDRGEGLSEHTAPFDALVIGIDGLAEITIAGERHQLSAGELLRLPAGQPHAVTALRPFKMLLVMIRA